MGFSLITNFYFSDLTKVNRVLYRKLHQSLKGFGGKNTAAVSPAITRINFIFTIKDRSEIDIAATASRFTRQPQNGKSI